MNSVAVRGWLLLAAVLALAYGGWISYRLQQDDARSTDPPLAVIVPAGEDLDRHPRPVGEFALPIKTAMPLARAI